MLTEWMLLFLALLPCLLGQLQCLPGYTRTPSGICARVNIESLDFDESDAACSAMSNGGGRLVSIHSVLDNRFLIDLARNSGIAFVYIGMRDVMRNGSFQWVDGTPVDYTAWCPGYPLPAGRNDVACTMVYLTSDECWQNTACDGRNASLCVQGNGSPICPSDYEWIEDACYKGFAGLIMFDDAEANCMADAVAIARNGHLASIHSKAINDRIAEMILALPLVPHDGSCVNDYWAWIGLRDVQSNGNYTWIDGTAFDWSPGPLVDYSCGFTNLLCGVQGLHDEYGWAGRNCQTSHQPYHVCKLTAT